MYIQALPPPKQGTGWPSSVAPSGTRILRLWKTRRGWLLLRCGWGEGNWSGVYKSVDGSSFQWVCQRSPAQSSDCVITSLETCGRLHPRHLPQLVFLPLLKCPLFPHDVTLGEAIENASKFILKDSSMVSWRIFFRSQLFFHSTRGRSPTQVFLKMGVMLIV